jgi:DNA-binding transcriptional LysR family regulator
MNDRFEAMQAFVAVCDTRGFAAAARRLQVSPSVVTRHVAALEARLGVRLLQRTTRSVAVTDAGARYLERARRILADIDEAELSAADERGAPKGRLVVSAPLLFGRMHIAPIVSALLNAHPALTIELSLSDRYVNLIDEGIDVAIRIGPLPDSSLISRRIGSTRRVLVASPSYLASSPALLTPADLPAHALIAFRVIANAREWRLRAKEGGDIAVAIEPRFVTNSGEAAIEHALRGGGITAALCYQVEDALASGTLVEVLPQFAPSPIPIQAVFPSSRLLSAKVRAFLTAVESPDASWKQHRVR